MTTQPELFKAAPAAPDTQRLLLLLLERGTWMTREQISEATGWTERTIRMLAEAAHDRHGPLIVRWQKGLCHRDHAPVEEMRRAGEQFKSQGKHMIREGMGYVRLAHWKLAGGVG